jgi:coenzyme F420-dependent oxidoreductase
MTELDMHIPVSAQPNVDTLVEYSKTAEELGYNRIWLPESWGRDAVTSLTVIAERTDDIGIGTSILNIFSRSPTLLGQTMATLQEVSDDRCRFGLGSSGPGVIERWHGVKFERPIKRTREYVEIINRVLSAEQVDYDGELFSLSGFRLRSDPPDIQPPIDVAGIGPKAVELAGRFADGWHPVFLSPSGLEDRFADFRHGLELGDRSESDLRVTYSIPCCALEDSDRARELGRNHLGFYIGGMGTFYRDSLRRQGYKQKANAIYDAWQDGDRERATSLVDDELLDSFVATGSPDQVEDVLERFRSIDGVDAIAANAPRGATSEEVFETIENLPLA